MEHPAHPSGSDSSRRKATPASGAAARTMPSSGSMPRCRMCRCGRWASCPSWGKSLDAIRHAAGIRTGSWIAGALDRDWLGASVSEAPAARPVAEPGAGTLEIGRTEAIPEQLILKAALLAAYASLGAGGDRVRLLCPAAGCFVPALDQRTPEMRRPTRSAGFSCPSSVSRGSPTSSSLCPRLPISIRSPGVDPRPNPRSQQNPGCCGWQSAIACVNAIAAIWGILDTDLAAPGAARDDPCVVAGRDFVERSNGQRSPPRTWPVAMLSPACRLPGGIRGQSQLDLGTADGAGMQLVGGLLVEPGTRL